jgi:hypothetical protein
MLQQAAHVAIVRHNYAESRAAIAKLLDDNRSIRDLEPLVESLLQARSVAVRAYQEHVDTHAQAAQAWWR